MDFSLSEEQEAIRNLARRILQERSTHERLKELEAGEERFDRRIWAEFAETNLLGVSLPEEVGGSGLSFLETFLILEEVGRYTAMVPLLATIVMGALPIAEFGTTAQRVSLLPSIISGDLILTAALVELAGDPLHPTTSARPDGDAWVLEGVKTCVPEGLLAERALVPATTTGDGRIGVFIVDLTSTGVTRQRQETTNRLLEARIELAGVRVGEADLLGTHDGGAEVVEWIVERATAGLCAMATGICEEALRRTAEYTKSREQFGRPIGSFQAVRQRAADAYIDTDAVRLTALQAGWRLAQGLPAAQAVAMAKFWAAEGGQRVVHAAQHLHGGIGIDLDYPLHRYFLSAKHLELTLGGATPQLLKIGALLAAEPA